MALGHGPRIGALVVLWVALALAHTALVFRFVLPGQVLDAEPFYRIDYPLHCENARDAARFLRESGHYWGYNPAFAAGFPQGLYDDPGNHAAGVAVAALGFLDPVRAFKLYTVATFLSVPFLLGLAARLLGFSSLAGWLLALLGTAVWQADPLFHLFRWFGSFNFVLGSLLALLVVAAAARYLETGRGKDWGVSAAVVVVALLAHPLVLPILLAPAVALVAVVIHGDLVRKRRLFVRGQSRRLAALAGAAGIGLLANLFWIGPVIRFRHYKGGFDFIGVTTGRSLVDELWLAHGHGHRLALLALAAIGLLAPGPLARPVRAALGLGVAALVLAMALVPSLPALGELEPGRFPIPALLLALPLATQALRAAVSHGPRWAIASAVALAVAILPFARDRDRSFVSRDFALAQVRTAPCAGLPWLEAELRRRVDPGRRVLYEEGTIGAQAHFCGYIAPRLQRACGAEFVGASYPMAPQLHALVSFASGRLLGRPIESLGAGELRHILELYNVGWAVAWSPASRQALAAPATGLREVARDGDLVVFERTDGEASFLLEGEGTATARPNVIEVDVRRAGRIVLKYHWLETLVAEPRGVVLERQMIAPDPVGFLAFEAKAAGHYLITNRY